MSRYFSNLIRRGFENFLPPILRDSFFFRLLLHAFFSRIAKANYSFKWTAYANSHQDFENFYGQDFSLKNDSYLTRRTIDKIFEFVVGPKVVDVGCGRTAYLARELNNRTALHVSAVDLIPPTHCLTDIEFVRQDLSKENFNIGLFDTVICCHTLEHILDLQLAMRNLRKSYTKKLIIVVPLEREYLYNLNPHVHFFSYAFSFLNRIAPVPIEHKIFEIDGDLVYIESKGVSNSK